MKNQELTNYIQKARQEGASDIEIRQNLSNSGWSASDIDEALSSTLISGFNTPASVNISKTTSESSGKVIVISVIILVVLLLGAGSWYGIGFIKSMSGQFKNTNSNAPEITDINVTYTPPTQTLPTEDLDVAGAKNSFSEIQKANNEKNVSLYEKYLSRKSVETFSAISGWQPIWYKEMSFVKAEEKDSSVIITVSLTQTNGKTETQEWLFIKEDGIWKVGLYEMLEAMEASMKNTQPTPPPTTSGGLPDLIISKIETFPNPPKVNNKETEIVITIKNKGSGQTTSQTVDVAVTLGDHAPATTGYFGTIKAGQEVTVRYKPFPFSFTKDQPGSKQIIFEVNDDHSTKETDYTNNKITRTIEFVE